MTATATEPTTRAEVVAIPIAQIDRDPHQPRFKENVDTDLAASFKAHGWFESEPLEIRPHPEDPERFMLVDGERRLAGAKAAGLKEALCVLTLDAEGTREGDRLLRQINHNSGKPLEPIEEAFAYQRIIDDRRAAGDKSFGVVQLAKLIPGAAKSTISDRLMLTALPKFWLDHIRKGPLQPSHAPIIHRWRGVPEEFQRRALQKMREDYEWPGSANWKRAHVSNRSEVLTGADLESMLWTHLEQYIKPLSEVGASYKGPVAELGDRYGGGQRRKYAMDPAQWQPIVQQRAIAEKKRKEREARERRKSGETPKRKASSQETLPRWIVALIEKGAKRVQSKDYQYQFPGEFLKVEANGRHVWQVGHERRPEEIFDPAVLMEHLAPAKVTVWVPKSLTAYNSIHLCTDDQSARRLAQSAFQKAATESFERILANTRGKVTKVNAPVGGTGAKHLLTLLIAQDDRDGSMTVLFDDLGAALDLKVFEGLGGVRGSEKRCKAIASLVARMTVAESTEFASALAAWTSLSIQTPAQTLEVSTKAQLEKYHAVHPKDWPALGKAVAKKGAQAVQAVEVPTPDPETTDPGEAGDGLMAVGAGAEEEE